MCLFHMFSAFVEHLGHSITTATPPSPDPPCPKQCCLICTLFERENQQVSDGGTGYFISKEYVRDCSPNINKSFVFTHPSHQS